MQLTGERTRTARRNGGKGKKGGGGNAGISQDLRPLAAATGEFPRDSYGETD